jgi:phenylacetate-CoA ligase
MRTILTILTVKALATLRRVLVLSDTTMLVVFIPGLERMRWNLGLRKAYVEHVRAKRRVPAYKDFTRQHTLGKIPFDGFVPDLTAVPIMDKSNYVARYSIGERCVGGTLPSRGVIVDESSGSSGLPTNWVRGAVERKINKRMLQFGLEQLVGKAPKFIINAFALGPWATGVNVTMAFADIAMLKSLGPDRRKIENTLVAFGSEYHYIIMGYPPFLKALVDTAAVDWNAFNVVFIYGGEGMSEAMRDYLLAKGVRKVYGSFGASDLELNISTENDFTIALRKELVRNKALAAKLVRHSGTLPMIFQYNPMDFYIETDPNGELLITLCRPNYISPKIRYNIHDRGHVVRMRELKQTLKDCNVDLNKLGIPASDLPLLFHYGRSDMAVAFFGCKIAPADMQEVIFRLPAITSEIESFTLMTYEDAEVNKQLKLCLELFEGKDPEDYDAQALAREMFAELENVNQDFRESVRMIPAGKEPSVALYKHGTGPFAESDIRIKLKYITNVPSAALSGSTERKTQA